MGLLCVSSTGDEKMELMVREGFVEVYSRHVGLSA